MTQHATSSNASLVAALHKGDIDMAHLLDAWAPCVKTEIDEPYRGEIIKQIQAENCGFPLVVRRRANITGSGAQSHRA